MAPEGGHELVRSMIEAHQPKGREVSQQLNEAWSVVPSTYNCPCLHFQRDLRLLSDILGYIHMHVLTYRPAHTQINKIIHIILKNERDEETGTWVACFQHWIKLHLISMTIYFS